MKKRGWKLSAILLCMVLFTGCSNEKEGTPTTKPSNETVETKAPEATKVPVEQLNIIEDNYRNYYEIYVGAFSDSNGDGVGDINGIINKLDYLNDNDPETNTDLGINGIWLMPIMPSPTYHKYDVTDYYNIDQKYGTMDDFKKLIAECDKRNIKLIIDLVFNHTSNRHEWFLSATDYLRQLPEGKEPSVKENQYVEYYNFKKDMKGKPGWRSVGGTDNWYYEGQFTAEMPDLNLDSPVVRKEIEDIASFWLDLGVGGFRLDAAKEYTSGSPETNVEVLNWFHQFVKSKNPDNYLVAEVWDTFGTIAQYYESGIDSIFNYALGNYDGVLVKTTNTVGNGQSGKTLAENMKTIQTTFQQRNATAIDAPFIANHDNNRVSAFVSYDLSKMKYIAGLNLMQNGSPFIYYGEEIGMTGSGKDENKRVGMVWSDTEVGPDPKAADKQEHRFPGVDKQLKDESSLLNYYIKAIRLRNENPEIARGTIELIPEAMKDGDICAITKTYKDSQIVIVINNGKETKEVTLDKANLGFERIKGQLNVGNETVTLNDGTVTIPSMSIVILK